MPSLAALRVGVGSTRAPPTPTLTAQDPATHRAHSDVTLPPQGEPASQQRWQVPQPWSQRHQQLLETVLALAGAVAQGAVRRHHSRHRGQDPALSRQLHLDAAHGRPHALTAAMAPAALPRAHLHAASRPSLDKRVQPRLGPGAHCQTLPIGSR